MNKSKIASSPVDIVVSLFVLPLFMAASAQTALVLVVVIPVFVVFMLSTLFSVLLAPRVPQALRELVRILMALFVTWVSWVVLALLFPLYSLVFQFSFMMIPVAWLGCGQAAQSHPRDSLFALGDAALEALSLSLLLLGGAILREFLTGFSLSLPSEDGARYLFSLSSARAHAPGGLAGAASAFALFVGVRLVYPLVRRRLRNAQKLPNKAAASSPVAPRLRDGASSSAPQVKQERSAAHQPPDVTSPSKGEFTQVHTGGEADLPARAQSAPSPLPPVADATDGVPSSDTAGEGSSEVDGLENREAPDA